MFGAAVILDSLVVLILIFQFVEQTVVHAFGGGERRLVNQRADAVGLKMALGGELGRQLGIKVADQSLVGFALGRRHLLFHKDVGGGFVLADGVKVGAHANPIQRAAQEQL